MGRRNGRRASRFNDRLANTRSSVSGRNRQFSFFGSGRSNRKRLLPLHQIATDRCGRGPDVHDDMVDWLQRLDSGSSRLDRSRMVSATMTAHSGSWFEPRSGRRRGLERSVYAREKPALGGSGASRRPQPCLIRDDQSGYMADKSPWGRHLPRDTSLLRAVVDFTPFGLGPAVSQP